MKTFVFQVGVQGLIIALLWVLVHRDARNLRERYGTTPASISAFAWGALCGLTWVALIPYLFLRRRVEGGNAPTKERNLLRWWIVLALASAVWASSELAREDANNGAQHVLLTGIFVVCGLIAWSRDREQVTTQP